MSEFQVGDEVMISEKSRFYKDGKRGNPIDTIGRIFQIADKKGLNIRVDWGGRIKNCYSKEDLILYTRVRYEDTSVI